MSMRRTPRPAPPPYNFGLWLGARAAPPRPGGGAAGGGDLQWWYSDASSREGRRFGSSRGGLLRLGFRRLQRDRLGRGDHGFTACRTLGRRGRGRRRSCRGSLRSSREDADIHQEPGWQGGYRRPDPARFRRIRGFFLQHAAHGPGRLERRRRGLGSRLI